MKSTSKIIIAFVACIILLAILSPFIFFTTDKSITYYENPTLLTGKMKTINTDKFRNLILSGSYRFNIVEDSTIAKPKITVDSGLNEYVKLLNDSIGNLYLTYFVPDSRFDGETASMDEIYDNGASDLTIFVPSGMLHAVEVSDYGIVVNLKNFTRSLVMKSASNQAYVNFRNCNMDFMSFSFSIYELCYLDLSLYESHVDTIEFGRNKYYSTIEGRISLNRTINSSIDNIKLNNNMQTLSVEPDVTLEKLTLTVDSISTPLKKYDISIPASTRLTATP